MMVPEYNFTVRRGEDFRPVLSIVDDNGNAIALHGYVVKMVIKKSEKSESVDVLSTTNGRVTTAYESNNAELLWSTEQTAAIKIGSYVYRVTLENYAGTNRRVVLEGKFYVLP